MKNSPIVKKKYDLCPICQEQLQEKNLIILSCNHSFCASCILKNLNYTRKCPLCRKEIIDNKFKSLGDKYISNIIVNDYVQQFNLEILLVKLYDILKTESEDTYFNLHEIQKECATKQLSLILKNFGLKLSNYIHLLYDK
tara:strand:+ start:34 stop:453 length:420 start_codon:yes stop_codon:yes gene_type:complete